MSIETIPITETIDLFDIRKLGRKVIALLRIPNDDTPQHNQAKNGANNGARKHPEDIELATTEDIDSGFDDDDDEGITGGGEPNPPKK